MGWIIALGVLTLLALMPIGVNVLYAQKGLFLTLALGPVRIQAFPRKGKRKDGHSDSEKARKEKSSDKKGGSLRDFLPLVETGLSFLKGFFRPFQIKKMDVDLVLAGSDPCDLAVNYGKTWAAVGNLIPLLDKLFVIKKRNVNVACDFEEEKSRIYVSVKARIAFGLLLVLVPRYGLKLILQYIGMQNKRKGGVTYEPESP